MESYTYEYNFDKHLDLFYAHAVIYDCFKDFPNMTTEKVQAFTRLYRRLIIAKQTNPSANTTDAQQLLSKMFPTWHEILSSQHTEKSWLAASKIIGSRLFTLLYLFYLSLRNR